MENNKIIFNNIDLSKGLYEKIYRYFFLSLTKFKINPNDKNYEFSVDWHELKPEHPNLYIVTGYYKYLKNNNLIKIFSIHIEAYTYNQLKHDFPHLF